MLTEKNKEEYLRKARPGNNGDCWEWSGALHSSGYGVFGWGSLKYAHRVSYEIHIGAIPDGMDVIHLCHNPRCSNPAHLSVGTRKENMATSFKVGRLQRKIPLEALPAITAQRSLGVTLQEIGNRYGCTKQAVRHMLNAHPELCHA